MKKRSVVLLALVIAAVATVALLFFLNRPGQRVSGLQRHEVYVWQRAWTQPVRLPTRMSQVDSFVGVWNNSHRLRIFLRYFSGVWPHSARKA